MGLIDIHVIVHNTSYIVLKYNSELSKRNTTRDVIELMNPNKKQIQINLIEVSHNHKAQKLKLKSDQLV